MTHVLPTENEAWGFYGALTRFADADAAWAEAFAQLRQATSCADYGVRGFLDSRQGRHFADEVLNHLAGGDDLASAIDQAIVTWQGWRIGRRLAKEEGIPAGLPYLTGWVAHHEATTQF